MVERFIRASDNGPTLRTTTFAPSRRMDDKTAAGVITRFGFIGGGLPCFILLYLTFVY